MKEGERGNERKVREIHSEGGRGGKGGGAAEGVDASEGGGKGKKVIGVEEMASRKWRNVWKGGTRTGAV